jgi:NMD protein affecting ribosome stability and mRNA decay
MRKVESCRHCGEEREIAAHGLCFKCYRETERAIKRQPDAVEQRRVDRHNPAIRKDAQHIFSAYAQLMVSLGKLGVSKADVRSVVDIIRPYLTPIAEYLRHSGQLEQVNSEQAPEAVHGSQGPQSEQSERGLVPFTVHKTEE